MANWHRSGSHAVQSEPTFYIESTMKTYTSCNRDGWLEVRLVLQELEPLVQDQVQQQELVQEEEELGHLTRQPVVEGSGHQRHHPKLLQPLEDQHQLRPLQCHMQAPLVVQQLALQEGSGHHGQHPKLLATLTQLQHSRSPQQDASSPRPVYAS